MNGVNEYTVATLTSTAHQARNWTELNWPGLEQQVNRIQTRIARAASLGDRAKIRMLQRMLVNSFAAKVLAVRQVTSTTGAKTPGIDGITWTTPREKWQGAMCLKKKGYKPKPLKRVYIDKGKGDGSKRPLGIPTIYDRAMQKLYAMALEPVAETWADQNSYGFRKGRSAKDAGERIFTIMARKANAQWVIEADIKGFFDNISHQWMLNNIPMDKDVLQMFLKAGFVNGNQLYPTEAGTPQGGVISPVLANMVLDGLNYLLQNKYWRNYPKGKVHARNNRHKVYLVRFADDFIVTADSIETCQTISSMIEPFLTERGVQLSEEKTKITHIDDGFDFLGWNFRKYKSKLLIKPSKKSVKSIVTKIRKVIADNPTSTQKELIRKLNPILRGWRNYHNHVVAAQAFRYVDNATFEALWSWACRRHKQKGKMWVKDRYWHVLAKDKWVFYDRSEKIGKQNPRLIRISKSKIVRHSTIKSSANPYLDREYFERRSLMLGAKRLTGKFRDIWLLQQGKCLYCNQPLGDDRNVHHNWPKAWGGTDGVTNLTYLHRLCHQAYHSRHPVRRTVSNCQKLEYIPILELGPKEQAIRQTLER